MNDIAQEFIKSGLMGSAIVALTVVIFFLWRSGNTERTRLMRLLMEQYDHRHMEILQLTDKVATALSSATNAIERQTDVVTDLQKAYQDLADEMRVVRRGSYHD